MNLNNNNNFNNKSFAQISVSDFKKELENIDVILIDVRTIEELSLYGKIREKQELIDINMNDFTSKILSLDKIKKYLIYCWHGNRSRTARNFMEENNFSYVKDLKGGIEEWKNEGNFIIK